MNKTKAKISIKTSDGKEYPCRMTMGALVLFERETGKDVSEMGQSMTEQAILLWCCVRSACAADGKKFDYSLQEFADNLDTNELAEFNVAMNSSTDDSKKKQGKA